MGVRNISEKSSDLFLSFTRLVTLLLSLSIPFNEKTPFGLALILYFTLNYPDKNGNPFSSII